jgi:hypothetical protein
MPVPTVPELLDFVAAHADVSRGRLEEAIRARFGISPARYYQLISRAVRTREAAEHDPTTTRQLIAQMDRRLRSRQERHPWSSSNSTPTS